MDSSGVRVCVFPSPFQVLERALTCREREIAFRILFERDNETPLSFLRCALVLSLLSLWVPAIWLMKNYPPCQHIHFQPNPLTTVTRVLYSVCHFTPINLHQPCYAVGRERSRIFLVVPYLVFLENRPDYTVNSRNLILHSS